MRPRPITYSHLYNFKVIPNSHPWWILRDNEFFVVKITLRFLRRYYRLRGGGTKEWMPFDHSTVTDSFIRLTTTTTPCRSKSGQRIKLKKASLDCTFRIVVAIELVYIFAKTSLILLDVLAFAVISCLAYDISYISSFFNEEEVCCTNDECIPIPFKCLACQAKFAHWT